MGRLLAAVGAGVAIAAVAFWTYAVLAGPQAASVGIEPHRWALGAIIIGVLTAPVWGAAFLAWLAAETEIGHNRPSRRFGRGQCPACGYPAQRICPECGTSVGPPPARARVQRRAAQWAFGAVAGGFLLGCAAAEGWAALDRAAFRREAAAFVAAGRAGMYWRACRWPMGGHTMHFEGMRGYWVND